MNYIDLVKVASMMVQTDEEVLDKIAGVGGVRKGHKELLKNLVRANAGTKSSVGKLRDQGLVATIPGIANEAPTVDGVANSSLALLGLAPSKPGKGRSLSKVRQTLTQPSKTTQEVLKKAPAPSTKVKGSDGTVRSTFNKDFKKEVFKGVDEAQAARETAKNIDHQFARNIRRGRAGLVPYEGAADAKSKKGLYGILAALGLTGAGAGGAAALLGGGAEAAPAAAAGLGGLGLAGAGAAGLAGAGLTYAGLGAIPALRKKRILRAAMAMLGGGAAAYGGLQALGGMQAPAQEA